MKTRVLKKISAFCLVFVISGAALACGGSKGGSCGDKDAKETAVFTTRCDGEKKEGCDKKDSCDKKAEDRAGCKGSNAGSRGCPRK